MNVNTTQALSAVYGIAGVITLAISLILMSTGVDNPVDRVVVVLGAAICGVLSL